MELQVLNKHIAIIGDGPSDFCVFKHLTKLIFKCHWKSHIADDNFLDLNRNGYNIHTSVEKYLLNTKSHKDYSLFSPDATKLKNEVINVLYTSISGLRKHNDISLTSKDILILNTDAEKILITSHNYFQDWAYILDNLLWFAVEQFYHNMTLEGFDYLNLPLILPVVLFPSTEIVLTPCIFDNIEAKGFRSFPPNPQLKQKIWETTDLNKEVTNNICETYLGEYDSINQIYKDIPEIRKFIQILSFK